MTIPKITSITKSIRQLLSDATYYKIIQIIAIFMSRNIIAVLIASVVIVGSGALGAASMANRVSKSIPKIQTDRPATVKINTDTTNNETTSTPQKVETINNKKATESKIIAKNNSNSIIAASPKETPNNSPGPIVGAVAGPTENDYQAAGIVTPPGQSAPIQNIPTQNNPIQNTYPSCAEVDPREPRSDHKNEDGANHDNDSYCPTVEAYCKVFTSDYICRIIKPETPNPSSWISYSISTSNFLGKVSGWTKVSPDGPRKCTQANFWFDKNGSTTPPAGWDYPIGIVSFYNVFELIPEEYKYCTNLKFQYHTYYPYYVDDTFDNAADGLVTIFTPYIATWRSYTPDSVYCKRYRINWEPFQMTNKGWWSSYRIYTDTIIATLMTDKYTYNNDFCKQLFDGTITIDITATNWAQFASDEYLNIGKQSFEKAIDAIGSLSDNPISYYPPYIP